MLLQQAQQPADQAVQPPVIHQPKSLRLLAAETLVTHRPWYSWRTYAEKALKNPKVDHVCKSALVTITKSPSEALKILLISSPTDAVVPKNHYFTPDTTQLFDIIFRYVQKKIAERPTSILTHNNLCQAVLPSINQKNISAEQKNRVYQTLAHMLSQSPEYIHAQETYFPNLVIESGQLNLEQILLLLLIAPSQNPNPLVITISQANAHNILTQRVFKTLPQPLQQTLRNQLSQAQINHLARRNLAILATIDSLAFLFEKTSLSQKVSSIFFNIPISLPSTNPENITKSEIYQIVVIEPWHWNFPLSVIKQMKERFPQLDNLQYIYYNRNIIFYPEQQLVIENLDINSFPMPSKEFLVKAIMRQRSRVRFAECTYATYWFTLNKLGLLHTQPKFWGLFSLKNQEKKFINMIALQTMSLAQTVFTAKSPAPKLVAWLIAGRILLKACAYGIRFNEIDVQHHPRLAAVCSNIVKLNYIVSVFDNPRYVVKNILSWLAFRAAAFEAAHR